MRKLLILTLCLSMALVILVHKNKVYGIAPQLEPEVPEILPEAPPNKAIVIPKVKPFHSPGDEILVEIEVGSTTSPINWDLFSISLILRYSPPEIIDLKPVDVLPGEFLGTDTLFFKIVDATKGEIKIANSQKRGANKVRGHGIIARVKFRLANYATETTQIRFHCENVTVRKIDGVCMSVDSKNATTVVVRLPLQVSINSPSQDVTLSERKPTFKWLPLHGNYSYLFSLDNNNDFSSPEIENRGTSNSYTPPEPLSDGIYYWRVRAIDERGLQGPWSVVWSVRIANVTIKPIVDPTVVYSGDQFVVNVEVGSDSAPVANLVGLSFVLKYDPKVMKANSAWIELGKLMDPSDILLSNVNQEEGNISIGIARKGERRITGFGSVVKIGFNLEPNTPAAQYFFDIAQTQCTAYDLTGKLIPLRTERGTVTVGGRFVVWPGDTDNNGVVNEEDIFPIAFYWHTRGTARPNASLEWKAQLAIPWKEIPATYADADGNGEVQVEDVLAVALNWNRVRSRSHNSPTLRPSVLAKSPCMDNLTDRDVDKYLQIYEAMYRVLENYPDQEGKGIKKVKAVIHQNIAILEKANLHTKNELGQNYPNPFNPEVWIPFTLTKATQVTIRIYNIKGELIRTLNLGMKEQGKYISKEKAAYWDGKNENGDEVASGVYFYQIQAGDFVSTKQMVVLK